MRGPVNIAYIDIDYIIELESTDALPGRKETAGKCVPFR